MKLMVEMDRFESRFPWWGADLQTMRNRLRRGRLKPLRDHLAEISDIIQVPLPHSPGDAIRLAVTPGQLEREPNKPLLLLIHGLTGCEDSDHVLVSARYFLEAGFPVARMNMRGAGPGQVLSGSMYHAGLTADLAEVIRSLKSRPEAKNGILIQAVSLGANMMLKYLGESGATAGVLGAVAVSAPIDLKAAQLRIEQPRNFIYHHVLLKDMLKGIAVLPKMHKALMGRDPSTIRSIYQFDGTIVAGYHGYEDADHYYQVNSAKSYLADIASPCLMIHAQDDPWIPTSCYEGLADNPHLYLQLTMRGGHVGFHDRSHGQPWHDRMALRFFNRVLDQA